MLLEVVNEENINSKNRIKDMWLKKLIRWSDLIKHEDKRKMNRKTSKTEGRTIIT